MFKLNKKTNISDYVALNNECSCSICKSMCHKAPCIGTPDDIEKIKSAGFGHKIADTVVLNPITLAVFEQGLVEIEAPVFDDSRGCCSFLTENGLCELHDLGLKPTEGRVSSCSSDTRRISLVKDCYIYILQKWMDK